MAEHSSYSEHTPDGGGHADRPVGIGRAARDILSHPDCLVATMLLGWLASLLIPGAWLMAIPACLIYGTWFNTLKFRLPMGWKGRDFSSRKPGERLAFGRAEGLLLLGNKCDTNEELWLSNDDARRHAFVLGTTGSGKALPLDALILSESGWQLVSDIRTGDRVMDASGSLCTVVGTYPQGRRQIVRMHFADGRTAECTADHLWQVNYAASSGSRTSLPPSGTETRCASDIAIQIGVGKIQCPEAPPLRLFVPLCKPCSGPHGGSMLNAVPGRTFATSGLDNCDFLPSLHGSPNERLAWLSDLLRRRDRIQPVRINHSSLEIPVFGAIDSFRLRQVIWSLGGIAGEFRASRRHFVRATFPGQHRAIKGAPRMDAETLRLGLEVMEVESLEASPAQESNARKRRRELNLPHNDGSLPSQHPASTGTRETLCIRTDAENGLFVMENYLVTHNTELLLGIASQSMMWSSGFLFIDGKGTGEFHGRVWSLATRFGRQDDYRLLNFTNAEGAIDSPAGGPVVQSNTLNPFSHGSPDQLINLIISLMGGQTGGAGFWQHRAMSLVTTAMKALCELRDAGDVLLDVQSIRDFLPLGIGVKADLLEGKEISDVSDIPDAAWSELRSRGGMIELYLRSLRGEFSNSSRLALKGFFDSLPGFSLHNALNGRAQEGKAAEQHGFLAMQLTKPLGALADDFGHIFRTPFGDVDIEDVVLNRRILVVLLPALQKAPEEMRNCGKIVVAVLKMMMGRTAGSEAVGSKKMLIDARSTNSPSPFIAILDEAGYYMVKGIDTMMAQARSLGFMIILAGQDMAAMQAVSPQIAETASANARLTAAGAMEDSQRTWNFLDKKFGTHRVPVVSGRTAVGGILGTRWVDRPDFAFVQQGRVQISDLQRLGLGEFYFMMESVLVRARAFYTGNYWTSELALNKFLLVRGPMDRAPGLDQSRDNTFRQGLLALGRTLLDASSLEEGLLPYSAAPSDLLGRMAMIAELGERTWARQGEDRRPDVYDGLAALLLAAEHDPDDSTAM